MMRRTPIIPAVTMKTMFAGERHEMRIGNACSVLRVPCSVPDLAGGSVDCEGLCS
jgi:hypothetical protein